VCSLKLAKHLQIIAQRLAIAVAACFGSLLLGAGGSAGYDINGSQAPLGVYAHVGVDSVIQQMRNNSEPVCSPVPTGDERSTLQSHLKQIYRDVLKDQAVAGITVGLPWCLLQPCETSGSGAPAPCDKTGWGGGFDWNYVLDPALVALNATDRPIKAAVKVIVNAGFDTPSWVLNKIGSCDTLFPTSGSGGSAPANCGKVSFSSFNEQQHVAGDVLPLPWNDTYVKFWNNVISEFGGIEGFAQSGGNSALISAIVLAGPTGSSTEWILPSAENEGLKVTDSHQQHFYPADKMWLAIIANTLNCSPIQCATLHGYKNYNFYAQTDKNGANYYDQIFVDAWIATVDEYQSLTFGATLVLSPDKGVGLPVLGALPDVAKISGVDQMIYDTLEAADCSATLKASQESCKAKSEILAHFVQATTNPQYVANLKATQVGGMTAKTKLDPGKIDVPGVKLLTAWPFPIPGPTPSFLGGAEFDHSVVDDTAEGCGATGSPPCKTVEEAAFNVLNVFFNCTSAAASGAPTNIFASNCATSSSPLVGTGPIQYVDLDYRDIKYASDPANQCPSKASMNNGVESCTSLQDVVNHAGAALFNMANLTWPLSLNSTCAKSPPKCN
jgi:hypothetical protein